MSFGSLDSAVISSEVLRRTVFEAVLGRRFGGGSSSTFTCSASKAFVRSIASVRTPSNRSPTLARRSHTLSMRKSCGSNPPCSTSSHVSGVETGARGSGRTE